MHTTMIQGRPRKHRVLAHWVRWPALGVLLALAVALVSCSDDGDGEDVGDGDLPTNRLEITVVDGGVDPGEVEVRLPDRYQLVVHNESSTDCEFDLGTFVRALEVPAGETGQIDVQLPTSASGDAAPGSEEIMDMGCAGDDERQGRLVVLTGTGTGLGD